MPLDPTALCLARVLVAEAGLKGFVPTGPAPACLCGDLIPICLIDSFARAPGVPIFDKPRPDRPGEIRSASILAAIRDGTPLSEPIELFQRVGEARYELVDGFHRLHLCAALGFTHMPAVVRDWKLGE